MKHLNSLHHLCQKHSAILQILAIVLVALLSHGIRLFHTGIFWDDWGVIGVDHNAVYENFILSGRPLSALINHFLGSSNDVVQSYVVLQFICYTMGSIFFFLILKKFVNSDDAFQISLLFSALPINTARHSVLIVNYVLPLCFFAVASYLLFSRKNALLRILSWVCFFISFNLEGNLVFYYGVLGCVFYLECQSYKEFFSPKRYLNKIDLLLLPIFYWVVRSQFFAPRGPYASSYSFSAKEFVSAAITSPIRIATYFVNIFSYQNYFRFADAIIVASLIPLTALVTFLLTKKTEDNEYPTFNLKACAIGVVLACLGIFPFIATGRIPIEQDWAGRFGIIASFGLTIFVLYALRLVLKKSFYSIGFSILLAGFIHKSATYSLSYFLDGIKQKSLVLNFKNNSDIANHHTFIVQDNTESMNALSREYRFYEYNGILKTSFGQETRIAVPSRHFHEVEWDSYFKFFEKKAIYNLSDYTLSKPTHKISIDLGKEVLGNEWKSLPGFLRLSRGGDEKMASLLTVRVEPLQDQMGM